ncbi:MAG: LicD family protein [Fibrobacter sp.]|nr:LicD family protein [Fibrobacter sp.]
MTKISISEMKQIQIDILKDIHQFCEKNNLHYTLIFGSLLGAIRHKGYIPWDDDIDIAMMRPDYEKFVASYSGKGGIYHVYDYRNNPDYHHPYAKVADTRTILEEHTSMKDIGINIDVFPFDYLADTKEESFHLIHALDSFKKKFRIKLVKPGIKNAWWKRILIHAAKVALFAWSMKKITEEEYQVVNKLTNADAKFIGVAIDPEIDAAYRSVYPRCMFEKFIKVPFDGEEFMVTAEYDKWLTQMYGDYMTPPRDCNKTSPHTLSNIYWID